MNFLPFFVIYDWKIFFFLGGGGNAAILFCCEAPEMFCELHNFTLTLHWHGGELIMINENMDWLIMKITGRLISNENNHPLQPCFRGCAAVVSTNKQSNRFCSCCLFRACRTWESCTLWTINTKGQHGRDWALVSVIKRLLVTPLWDPSQEKAEISGGEQQECSQSTLNVCLQTFL